MANDVSLRPATASDVLRLRAVVDAAYGHYVTRLGEPPGPMLDDYDRVVARYPVTVAERGGEIAGFVVLEPESDDLVVHNVAVAPAHQGTGVGRALLEHAEAVARSAGLRSLRLWTHELMVENLALYARIGYVAYERPEAPSFLVHLRKTLG